MSKVNITKEELEELYINLELSTRDIAKKLGVGQTTIRRWLSKFEIKARTSKEAKHTTVYKEKEAKLAERYRTEYVKTYTKICPNCGKEFTTTGRNKDKKYCCKECEISARSTREYRINENGEKEYKNTYTCELCGKKYTFYSNRYYTRRFCDDCLSKHKSDLFSNKIKTYCAYCSKEIEVIPSRYYSNECCYCDVICMAKDYEKRFSGENSPTWKGGVNKHYKGHWKRLATLCRERDHNCCLICGKTKEENDNHNMDVHHIRKYRYFDNPEEANQLDNLISLCHSCHSFIHSKSNIDKLYIIDE